MFVVRDREVFDAIRRCRVRIVAALRIFPAVAHLVLVIDCDRAVRFQERTKQGQGLPLVNAPGRNIAFAVCSFISAFVADAPSVESGGMLISG